MSRSTSAGVTTDSASSYRAIENLIATYAELVDGGDFAGIGALLADASFTEWIATGAYRVGGSMSYEPPLVARRT